MSEVSIFPTGLYWIRIHGSSIGERDAEYAALWLFPTGNFRYIACWPGYSWFDASGTWLYGMGLIHCRGKSHYFSDNLSDCHDNRPYTSAFTPCHDEQAVVSVEASPQRYTRLPPQQLGSIFTLDEKNVPSRWQDLKKLVREIERVVQPAPDDNSGISICNGDERGITIRWRPEA
jgi:hypothetical protein